VAHYQARVYADINAVSEAVSELANLDHPDQQDVFYTTASEVRAALCLTRRATITGPGKTAGSPPTTISDHSADTTTEPNTSRAGN
jgi:hypothetical protein